MQLVHASIRKALSFLLFHISICIAGGGSVFGQCSTSSAPTYSRSCFTEYFTSITAAGGSSTISVSASGCTGTYSDLHATQGIEAGMGNFVTVSFGRCSSAYTAYVSIFIDWNSSGTYETDELVNNASTGSVVILAPGTTSGTYVFQVPYCRAFPGQTLRMRMMLSEEIHNAGAPCTGNYGQAYDLYFKMTGCAAAISISGASSICTGGGTTLTSNMLCGSWSSTNSSVASVGSMGNVSGVSAGTATISYSTPTCGTATMVVSVGLPSITGSSTVCAGATTTFGTGAPGGTWSSSNTGIATVGTGGVVSGVASGSATITYISPGGCQNTKAITVSGGAISGDDICVGSSRHFSASSPGGTWSTSNSVIANVNSSGLVSGVDVGTAVISYTLDGCTDTWLMTVNPMATISGPTTVSCGGSINLTASGGGGLFSNWSSSNTAIATVSSGGVVTAISGGVVTISYTTSQCSAFKTITVGGPSLVGSNFACVGNTATITPGTGGGTWSSSNTGVATINSSGVYTGVSGGTATMTYTQGGCSSTMMVTIEQATLSGNSYVCEGAPTVLTPSPTGGTWSSSNDAIATFPSPSGVVAVANGTVTVTYTSPNGCVATKAITAHVITGPAYLCEGDSYTYWVDIGGGTWSADEPARAFFNDPMTDGHMRALFPIGLDNDDLAATTIRCVTSVCTFVQTFVSYRAPRFGPDLGSGFHVPVSSSFHMEALQPLYGTWSTSAPSVLSVVYDHTTGIENVANANALSVGTSNVTYTVIYTDGPTCAISHLFTIDP